MGVKLSLIKCLGVRRSIVYFLVSIHDGQGEGESLGIGVFVLYVLGVELSLCVWCSCSWQILCAWGSVGLRVYFYLNLCVYSSILLCECSRRDL